MPKLTKRAADAAKRAESDRVQWDKELRRFGRGRRSGVCAFVVQYRLHGCIRVHTLGKEASRKRLFPTRNARYLPTSQRFTAVWTPSARPSA